MSENSYSWIGAVAIAAVIGYGIYTLRDWFGNDRGLSLSGSNIPGGTDAYLPTSQSSPVNVYISGLSKEEQKAIVSGDLSGQSAKTQSITANAYKYDLYHPTNTFGVFTSGWNNPTLDVQTIGGSSSAVNAISAGVTKTSAANKSTIATTSAKMMIISSPSRNVSSSKASYTPTSSKVKLAKVLGGISKKSVDPNKI